MKFRHKQRTVTVQTGIGKTLAKQVDVLVPVGDVDREMPQAAFEDEKQRRWPAGPAARDWVKKAHRLRRLAPPSSRRSFGASRRSSSNKRRNRVNAAAAGGVGG